MKKVYILICALFALVSCNIESLNVDTPNQNEKGKIKVNFTITRTDAVADTKATVKKNWADGDIVYIFFSRVAAPKYLELIYSATDKQWTPDPKGGLTEDDLSLIGNLTAVYLPHGAGYSVAYDETKNPGGIFTIQKGGADYCGHFYYSSCQPFSYDSSTQTLSGVINLSAALPISGSDKLVHFDISGGFDPTHTYVLCQDYMKPLTLEKIDRSNTGPDNNGRRITRKVGNIGADIPGFVYSYKEGETTKTILSFSGILDGSAVGETMPYRFVIHDKTTGIAYSRTNITGKKIDDNIYIGIGDISNATNWSPIASPYFSVSPTKLVAFAPANLVYDNGKWKFHANQYDRCISEVKTAGEAASIFTEGGTFDLFSWGSSGYNDGTHNDKPWVNGGVNTQYGPVGADIAGTLYDWGVRNTIYTSNEANSFDPGHWRTPTAGQSKSGSYKTGEWDYLVAYTDYLPSRDDAMNKRGVGTVNGVPGLIILPDHFVDPKKNKGTDDFVATTTETTTYEENVYTAEGWGSMQANGAVFLPACGWRGGNGSISLKLNDDTYIGQYWGSNYCSLYGESETQYPNQAGQLAFSRISGVTYISVNGHNNGGRNRGLSVRLVHDLN